MFDCAWNEQGVLFFFPRASTTPTTRERRRAEGRPDNLTCRRDGPTTAAVTNALRMADQRVI